MPRLLRLVLVLRVPTLLGVGLLSATATSAGAHEERPAVFPDGTGTRPTFLGYDNSNHRVVCRPESRARIAKMPDGERKRLAPRGVLPQLHGDLPAAGIGSSAGDRGARWGRPAAAVLAGDVLLDVLDVVARCA